MKIYSFLSIIFFTALYSQVGIGTVKPDTSSILDLTSANKGFLLPRISLTGTNDNSTISNPANGLLAFNLSAIGSGSTAVSANSLYFRQNSIWQKFTSSLEIDALIKPRQFIIQSYTNQVLTSAQLSGINNSEVYEVPITWSSNEISISNPDNVEFNSDNQSFRIKTSGVYTILSNLTINPKRNVNTDNSNYTYVTITLSVSKDSGSSWTSAAGAAIPYDVGSSNTTQTLILPRTFLSFVQNDLVRISISKPGSSTPTYGAGAGVVAKASGDITKFFRINKIN